jgi:cystathionine beta-lyase/cystathionine gamma-synthase
MAESRRPQRIETEIIHAGEPLIEGAISMPVFQSSTFLYRGETSYHDLRYIRLNNTPNHVALHAKLAALEKGEAALVAASGMAAISTTLLTLLGAGDHILLQESLYGGTHDLVTKDLPRLGITHSFLDVDAPATWEKQLRPTTKAIYTETISNPTLRVADAPAVVAFARAHKLTSVIDNTFASPIHFRPLEHGFDLSVHSCTKYLNGHTDIVAGAVIGRKALIESIKHKLDHFGGCLDPHACFLLHRGLKTLAVRVRQQAESALKIARFLAEHRAVAAVHHPGLVGHPHHARAKALFGGACAMVSFELKGGADAAQRLLDRVTIPYRTASLGGVESLVTRPATTSHAGLSPEDRRRLGVTDGLIRLSVGLEAADDLIEDLDLALAP